eukprot:scaffold25616_cov79-Isochrysis_galbana.AAC.1
MGEGRWKGPRPRAGRRSVVGGRGELWRRDREVSCRNPRHWASHWARPGVWAPLPPVPPPVAAAPPRYLPQPEPSARVSQLDQPTTPCSQRSRGGKAVTACSVHRNPPTRPTPHRYRRQPVAGGGRAPAVSQ